MSPNRRGARPVPARELIARAERQTGLCDWGDDDFRTGLEVLLESLERDVEPHQNGRMFFLNLLFHALVGRLRLNDELKRAGDALDQPLRRPLVIAAPPRSGSTLLHRLLAQHPDALYLPTWVLLEPMPPPSSLREPDPDRHQRARATLDLQAGLAPALGVRHTIDADTPEDDDFLALSSFRARLYWAVAPVHGFVEWIAGQPPADRYRSIAAQLRLLQRGQPGTHWVLKSPIHFYALKSLLEELPDANVVVIHRDPLEVLPSLHSMFVALHATVTDRPQRVRTVATNTDALIAASSRFVALADGPQAERIHHIPYRSLTDDPIATARAVHEHYELPWDDSIAARMTAWLAANPRQQHGEHRYDIERFGQNAGEVRAAFCDYLERFGKLI